jgi:hypothetical protein
MIRTAHSIILLFLASLSGCSSTGPATDEIARESAETNALLEAAKNHPAVKDKSAEASGKPLPPLPGVTSAAPKTLPELEHGPHRH